MRKSTIDRLVASGAIDGPKFYDDPQNPIEPGSQVYLGDFHDPGWGKSESGSWYILNDFTGGDYSGDGVLGIANARAFLRDYGTVAGVTGFYGGHGTIGIAIRAGHLAEPDMGHGGDDTMVGRIIACRESYPVYDDETFSEVEAEVIDETWTDSYARDYLTMRCESTHPDAEDHPCDDCDAIDLASPDLRGDFEAALEGAGEQWIVESPTGAYVDLDRLFPTVAARRDARREADRVARANWERLSRECDSLADMWFGRDRYDVQYDASRESGRIVSTRIPARTRANLGIGIA